MDKNLTSKQIEKQAYKIVEEYERKDERTAERAKRGSGYDLLSQGKNETRKIEVKGNKREVSFITLNSWNIDALKKHKEWWLYIVENVDNPPKEPKVTRLSRDEVLDRHEKYKKERCSWEIPTPKKQRTAQK